MEATIDTISPAGMAYGSLAAMLVNNNFDTDALRPFVGPGGRTYVNRRNPTTNKDEAVPVHNATATLRKDDWIALDEALIKVAKPRLKVVGDLRGAGLTYTVPNGMAKTVLQFERVSDISPATISMDGVRRSDSDRPLFDLVNLPLPIIHKDFHFTARQLAASRAGMSPLDLTTAELAARQVAEAAESLVLGTYGTYAFGGGNIYGYTNFPSRQTQSITVPTGSNQSVTLNEVLAMKQKSINANRFGPWMLYCGLNWDQYMDGDYNLYQNQTLRQRLRQIEGIVDVRTVDYLNTGYPLILVQQSSDVVRLVVGMEMTTVQWETDGGMVQHFKVMTILVPQLRTDQNNSSGIVHGS